MSEYEYEEIRGLPGRLPEGETILWQGAPSWRALARRTFRINAIALYFAIIVVVRGLVAAFVDGASPAGAVLAALFVLPIALVGLALIAGLAWWHARTTVYTITDQRVVMRFGIALQLAINLPFKEIGSASLMELPSGHGEIPLSLTGSGRLAYLHLWPHARPGRFSQPEPMLRCVPNGAAVAQCLSTAWAARRGHDTAVETAPPVSQAVESPVDRSVSPALTAAGAAG